MYCAVLYIRNKKVKKGTQSKKKSDVENVGDFEGDFEDESENDFEDFLSTAVKEAVEWVANNPSDNNDNPESEENGDE